MNLRPSGYEPNIFGGFLPTNWGGGQMVDRSDEPDTVADNWWTDTTGISLTLLSHHLATQVSVNLMIAV